MIIFMAVSSGVSMMTFDDSGSEQYWVYILLCENNTLYTGYTNDLMKRFKSHCDGTGKCKYTKSFKAIHIAQSWKINGSKAFAMQLERRIKKLSRSEKEALILQPRLLSEDERVLPDIPDTPND